MRRDPRGSGSSRHRSLPREACRLVPPPVPVPLSARQQRIKLKNKTTFLPPRQVSCGERDDLPAAAPGGGRDRATVRATGRCAHRWTPCLPQRRRETKAGAGSSRRVLPGRPPPASAGSGPAQIGALPSAKPMPMRCRCGCGAAVLVPYLGATYFGNRR